MCVCACVHACAQQRLLWLLSLLDTVEVAVEIMSEMKLGEPGKYAVVFLMQIIKCVYNSD